MKVVHIESGLGNQMLSYCEYLAMKKMNPSDTCCIETIVYDIAECNDVICQWNGFELADIFHIDAPNISDHFTAQQWAAIVADVRASRFWLRNWNYPVHITAAFRRAGLELRNILGDFEAPGMPNKTMLSVPRYQKTYLFQYLNFLRKKYLRKHQATTPPPAINHLFVHTDEDIFCGQQLLFKYNGSGIERIDREIREAFTFPAITDQRNLQAINEMASVPSVAIHARRGDMLSFNFDCYHGGYFKRAVSFIKSQVGDPHFYIFCDPGSVEWAKSHSGVLGLDFRRDKIRFVDWNGGRDSWRDMQLMAACKHQVITRSSFGWWGAYLNEFPDKITCSPDIIFNTTHHF